MRKIRKRKTTGKIVRTRQRLRVRRRVEQKIARRHKSGALDKPAETVRAAALFHQPVNAGTPTPSLILMTQDILVDQLGSDWEPIEPSVETASPVSEISAEQPAIPAAAFSDEPADNVLVDDELGNPKAASANVVEVTDLFDAKGNLVVPSGVTSSLPLAEAVAPTQAEPSLAAADRVVTDSRASEVNLLTSEFDVAVDLVAPAPSIAQPQSLHKINSLTVAGIFRLAVWPVKFLYWPFRLSALRRKREVFEQQYHLVAAPADRGNGRRLNLGRLSVQFITACVVLLLPIHIAVYWQDLADARDRVIRHSRLALSALQAGRTELAGLRWYAAADYFQRAQVDFQTARDDYRRLNFFTKAFLQVVPQGRRTVKAGLSLVSAGEGLAEIGRDVSGDLAAMSGEEGWQDVPALLGEISHFQQSVAAVLPRVAYAKTALANVDVDKISWPNRDSFLNAANSLPQIEATLQDSEALTRTILQLLGSPRWQRYLVLFQNDSELRATGGFLGSFALMDIEDGKIINLEVPGEGSYQLQGQLRALVASPVPLQVVKSRWEFQDANWWPDFALSAKKAAWFYEESGGPSVDGVIALTNTMLERMLTVVGPIDMPEYGRTIEADNFTRETQLLVESEYDRAVNRPKQFLADLAPRILERVMQLSGDQQRQLLTQLYEGLREKHVMLYSQNPQAQEIFEELDWAGRLQSVGLSDYLLVVSTNIGGGKTDRVITTDIQHVARVTEHGAIEVGLTITKTHGGTAGDPFTGGRNNSYLRVYVPAGSEFLGADGFAEPAGIKYEPVDAAYGVDADLLAIEGQHQRDPVSGVETYREAGKTVFAHWLSLEPGEVKSATLRYRLPFTLAQANRAYTLLVQKQAGTLGNSFTSLLQSPAGATLARTYPSADDPRLRIVGRAITFSDNLVTDKFYGAVFNAEAE